MTTSQNSTAAAEPKKGGFAGLFKKVMPDALVVLFFLAISFFYFMEPLSQGLELGGHDSDASIGLGREQQEYVEQTGEVTRWIGSVFSGMPSYQISPSYEPIHLLGKVAKVYGLGTYGVLSYVFLYLLGFYVLMRTFRFKPWLSALGAVAWAFSSYFFIIIAAGHIWKVMTLAFIPPTIAGLVLCYRGKLLWGGALTALFTGFQIHSNHVQMSYYFLFVMGFIVLAYLVEALIKREGLLRFAKATGVVVLAGLLGLAVNLPNLYHTYEYSKESMRGKGELTPPPSAMSQQTDGGLERDYITNWSYGIDETLTLLIPNFKGGGSGMVTEIPNIDQHEAYPRFYQCAIQAQGAMGEAGVQGPLPGLDQYWGDQPFTVGPVYVGAFICFLFVLGLFYVRGPLKWGLLAATILSLLFAWGRNLMPVTNFFIDYLPMYNKFRTVSSALVMAEFTMPFLAMLCLAEIVRRPEVLGERRIGLLVAFALTGGLSLLYAVFPSAAGDCLSANEVQAMARLSTVLPPDFMAAYADSVSAIRHSVLSADAWRSFWIVLAGVVMLWCYGRGYLKSWLLCLLLLAMTLVEMWQINTRYLNVDNFTDPVQRREQLQKTPADELILQDPDPHYRVLNLGGGNPFNENNTSYWHKSIGGYHAAKLHRYQDLIERRITPEYYAMVQQLAMAEGNMEAIAGDSVMPVLNMLNMKYLILGQGAQAQPFLNSHANGNGWFVEKLTYVKNADEEMAALAHLDTKHEAVAAERFKEQLGEGALGTGSVKLTSHAPNELHYDVESANGGLVVFSEIYYPGWTATVDGQEVELGRVNYVLRAMRMPAGKHKVVLEFRPKTVDVTNTIAYVALVLILALFGLALFINLRKQK